MTEAEKERAAVVYFIACSAQDYPQHGWPVWKLFLWGLLHPVQLRIISDRLRTLNDLLDAISCRDHLTGRP